MIDRITITVEQDGFWRIDGGGVLSSRTGSIHELLLSVKDLSVKLGYFPQKNEPIQHEPIPYHRLSFPAARATDRQVKKETAARKRAEAHLDGLQKSAQQTGPAPDAGAQT